MQTNDDWSAGWTARFGQAVRRERQRRGWSAQELAARCAALGVPVTRSSLADLETGRRPSVTVQTVTAVAAALDVPPVVLLYPLDDGTEPVRVLPDGESLPVDAIAWWSGEGNDRVALAMSERDAHDVAVKNAQRLESARQYVRDKKVGIVRPEHDLWEDSPGADGPTDPIELATYGFTAALENLRALRTEMTSSGMKPPPVDESIREFIENPGKDSDS